MSAYSGGVLSYDLKVFEGSDYFNDLDVILSNGAQSVSWSSEVNPVGGGWVTFKVQLTSGNFGASLASVLSNVTSFAIRGEMINGAEAEGFDNVRLAAANGVPEASTWVMALLGFGTIGLVASRRRRSTSLA